MIGKLSHRITWTLVVCCLAASVAADPYHPHIKTAQVVSLDVAAIERDANSGAPFELAFGDTRLTVALLPAPVWPEEGLTVLDVGADGAIKRRIVQGNVTYAGDVVGEDPEQSEVRFTITGGVVDGYVMSSTGWWFVEPLARFDPKATPGQHLVYAARDVDYAVDYGDDGSNMDEVTGWETPPPADPKWEIRIVMVGDQDYIFAPDPMPYEMRHTSLIHMINGIYWGQTFRQFELRVSIGDFEDTFLTSTNPDKLLNEQLKLFVAFAAAVPPDPTATPTTMGLRGLNNFGAYMAHLTTAKDPDGDNEGLANLFGRFAYSRQEVGQDFKNKILASHEIGHNFGGTHEAEVCPSTQHMILCASFIPNTLPVFSDGTLGPMKNNRKTIRDFMAVQGF